MVASVLHLAKHLWNAERKKEEEEEGGESRPLPLTHIAQAIPHQGHTNTSTLPESSSLNRLRNHTNSKPRLRKRHSCMHDSLGSREGPHATLRSDPIRLVDDKGGCRRRAREDDTLTLFKELRHDVLVVVGRFDFFCDSCSLLISATSLFLSVCSRFSLLQLPCISVS
ncbi:hypothetical protein EYF80_047199 [Liparis tanakae]|uniref:Uncharacterized protein n=1 Tax=Liparis tanakae TaxID=230148 RepID=A0A4Z2FQI7_9TELE|nr:hypothetical protein EYF80_047199 [Liparis tanakae]